MPGNSYTNWGKVTPRHDAFMEKVLQSPIHIISTVRGKDTYVLEDRNGKQVPKKVGMGYKQRDNTEYNYTLTFNIAQDTHIAEAQKDNTHLFEGRYDVLTERDGKALFDWANAGDAPAPKPVNKSAAEEELVADVPVAEKSKIEMAIDSINKLAKELADSGVAKKTISDIIKSVSGSANYNKITDFEVATDVYKELVALKNKED